MAQTLIQGSEANKGMRNHSTPGATATRSRHRSAARRRGDKSIPTAAPCSVVMLIAVILTLRIPQDPAIRTQSSLSARSDGIASTRCQKIEHTHIVRFDMRQKARILRSAADDGGEQRRTQPIKGTL